MWGWMKTSSETDDRVTAKSDTIIWFWFQLLKSCRKQNPNEQNDTLIRADNQNNLPMNMHSLTELRFCSLSFLPQFLAISGGPNGGVHGVNLLKKPSLRGGEKNGHKCI